MGQAREKTQTGGVVMSYRYEDGSLQAFLEKNPELLRCILDLTERFKQKSTAHSFLSVRCDFYAIFRGEEALIQSNRARIEFWCCSVLTAISLTAKSTSVMPCSVQ